MKRRDFLQTTGGIASAMICGELGAQTRTTTKGIGAMPDYTPTGAHLIQGSTPKADGFYFPAEWEEHEYAIMVMPSPQNWKGFGIPLNDVRGQWADVANKLSEHEPVLMVVRPEDRMLAKKILNSEIEFVEFPVNDGWSRDSGPMFVVNDAGQRRVAGFTFNGWGAKFPPYHDDALLKGRLCKHLNTSMYPIDMVLEGGAVTVDGEGTLITTEQCLLHKNRNADDRTKIERTLNDALGTEKVIWLGKGLAPDPVTDGHIDGIAAFAEPGTVLLHTTDDRSDVNYAICQDAKRRLKEAVDAKGRKFEVIEIPLDGDVSYMNYYMANDAILVPITSDPDQDDRPLGILREVFDDYEVIGIDANVLGEGGGGIHCITQQVPKI
ncbi:MAG: agmatine deiminase family protein [Rubripirellula sp.]